MAIATPARKKAAVVAPNGAGAATEETHAPLRLKIPELRIAETLIRIEGTTPLIAHRFSDRVQREIADKQEGAARVKKAPRDPELEFREAQYHLADGQHAFPAIAIKRAMVSAGQRYAGERGTELYGAITIPGTLLPLIAAEPTMRADRVVLSGPSRTSSIAYRPQYDPWAIEFPLQFNEDFITFHQIANLLQYAGFAVGIGDWRVEKKGSFGQFVVVQD